ncbi:hypothetical protein SmJEL517_g01290 [Synchytrium microbalum]|uniref:UBA domain-containing protein n=1 Tax=Synchytrium microbalum TaxID=1806994 RepID=A0A507C4W4_9FUNG|nr:uncharacterized protein SmJEL517_g01290 [Synchytrium microbalum]TPX36590.1 hypothetical protein SmJEL517_g01290 [Synchytrium microbalum]
MHEAWKQGIDYTPNETEIHNIEDLGFTADEAIRALKRSKGNADQAAEWLLSGAPEAEPVVTTAVADQWNAASTLAQMPLNVHETEDEQLQRALAMSLDTSGGGGDSGGASASAPIGSQSTAVIPKVDVPWATDANSNGNWDATNNYDTGWSTTPDFATSLDKRTSHTTPVGLVPCEDYPLLTGFLQALYAIPEARYQVASLPRSETLNKPGFELQNLFAMMAHSERKYVDPLPFVQTFRQKGGIDDFKDLLKKFVDKVTGGASNAIRDLLTMELTYDCGNRLDVRPKTQHLCLELLTASTPYGVPLEYSVRDFFHNLLQQDTSGETERKRITRYPTVLCIQPTPAFFPRLLKMDGNYELSLSRFGLHYNDYNRLDEINRELDKLHAKIASKERLENVKHATEFARISSYLGAQDPDPADVTYTDNPELLQAAHAQRRQFLEDLDMVDSIYKEHMQAVARKRVVLSLFSEFVFDLGGCTLTFYQLSQLTHYFKRHFIEAEESYAQLQELKRREESRHFDDYVLICAIATSPYSSKEFSADNVSYVRDLTGVKRWWKLRHLHAEVQSVTEDQVQGALVTDPIYALVYAHKMALSRGGDVAYPPDAIQMVQRDNIELYHDIDQSNASKSHNNDHQNSSSSSLSGALGDPMEIPFPENEDPPLAQIIGADVAPLSNDEDERTQMDVDLEGASQEMS